VSLFFYFFPPICARTKENIETVDDLVLSQQKKPQTYRTIRKISRETGIHWPSVSRIVRTCIWNVSRGAVHRSWHANFAARMKRAKLLLQKFPQYAIDRLCFLYRQKKCSRSLHLTVGRTKSVADCGNLWRRSLAFFFSAGTAWSAAVWPPVNCDCVPQLFEQLINITLCPAFIRKFVCQSLCCVFLQIQILSKSCPLCLIPCWLLTNTAVTSAAWRISDAKNWSQK